MDNLTHSLLGAALARTPLGKLHARSTLLLVVAANLPDIDIVSLLGGRETYLVHHRGITHSILGVAAQIVLMAGVVRAWEAWRAQRGGPSPSPWRSLLLLCGAGLASHPLLDFLNTYGWRPWLPFDSTWYYGDLVFIVDPWLWLIFGGAAALAGARSRSGNVCLALAAVAGGAVLFTSPMTPRFVLWTFPLAAAAIAGLRATGIGARRPGRILCAIAALAAIYLTLLGNCGAAAESRATHELSAVADIEDAPGPVIRMPEPAAPWRWSILFDHPTCVYEQSVDLTRSSDPEQQRFDKHADDPRVQAALAEPCTAWWRSFARVYYAQVDELDSGTFVRLQDARYHAPWCSAEVLIQKDGTALCLDELSGSPDAASLRSRDDRKR